MTDFEKPVYLPARDLFGAQGFLRTTATKVALLLGLIVYGIGFALLCPLPQASASGSATEGYEPMLLIGP
jgi:hypothetical protein